jgi:hypothetical protein
LLHSLLTPAHPSLHADEKDKAQEVEMKGFDDFQREKHELNTLLQIFEWYVDCTTRSQELNSIAPHIVS